MIWLSAVRLLMRPSAACHSCVDKVELIDMQTSEQNSAPIYRQRHACAWQQIAHGGQQQHVQTTEESSTTSRSMLPRPNKVLSSNCSQGTSSFRLPAYRAWHPKRFIRQAAATKEPFKESHIKFCNCILQYHNISGHWYSWCCWLHDA